MCWAQCSERQIRQQVLEAFTRQQEMDTVTPITGHVTEMHNSGFATRCPFCQGAARGGQERSCLAGERDVRSALWFSLGPSTAEFRWQPAGEEWHCRTSWCFGGHLGLALADEWRVASSEHVPSRPVCIFPCQCKILQKSPSGCSQVPEHSAGEETLFPLYPS